MIERCTKLLTVALLVGEEPPGWAITPYQLSTCWLLRSPLLRYCPVPKNTHTLAVVGSSPASMPPVIGCGFELPLESSINCVEKMTVPVVLTPPRVLGSVL